MSVQPDRLGNPAETVELFGRLKTWAETVGGGADEMAADLAEIHAAAKVIVGSIESLARVPPPSSADSRSTLVNLNAWINEELVDHIASLNTRLPDVIERAYEDG